MDSSVHHGDGLGGSGLERPIKLADLRIADHREQKDPAATGTYPEAWWAKYPLKFRAVLEMEEGVS